MDIDKLIAEIDLRFKSGNSISADRAHIKPGEWEAIKEHMEAMDMQARADAAFSDWTSQS